MSGRRSGKHIFALGLVIALFASVPGAAVVGIEKHVIFPKGKTTVLYKGKLALGAYEYDAYYFGAKRGKTLTVKLTCDDPDACLAIYETKILGPDEDTIVANDRRLREWTGSLPVTGEYSVQVYDASENGINRAAYTIEITVR